MDLSYEYSENGVSISIKAHSSPQNPSEEVQAVDPTIPLEEAQETKQSSNSWVDYATLILLAVLVLGEFKDKYSKRKTA